MLDPPVIHVNYHDYVDVDRQLSDSGYRCFVKLQDNKRIPRGYYAIGQPVSINGGMHPLWVLYKHLWARGQGTT